MPVSVASKPAGAFQTPRCESVREKIPATAPQGTNDSIWLPCRGSVSFKRGKKTAAFLLFVPRALTPDFARSTLVQLLGGSTRSIARLSSHNVAALGTEGRVFYVIGGV